MAYDSGMSTNYCFLCETGYGLSEDKQSCLTPSANEACLNGVTVDDGASCTNCAFYSGYFSDGLVDDDDTKQSCTYLGLTSTVVKFAVGGALALASVLAYF